MLLLRGSQAVRGAVATCRKPVQLGAVLPLWPGSAGNGSLGSHLLAGLARGAGLGCGWPLLEEQPLPFCLIPRCHEDITDVALKGS